jgi:hypothetical protein
MAVQVVTPTNLGNEFDLGTIEAGKIHVKLGSGLVRNAATGVISFDASVLPADVHMQGLNWNPATNELTLTESDGSTHGVNLATLAADKFLQGSSYDPATNELILVMTDGSTYVIDLTDLAPVGSTGGIQGTGVTGNEIRPDFDNLPLAPDGVYAETDTFVMSTLAQPDGARVPLINVADLLYNFFVPGGYLDVQSGVGVSGNGQSVPLFLDADELPLAGGSFDTNAPTNYTVMSTLAFPDGCRVGPLQAAENQWIGYTENAVENLLDTAVPSIIAAQLTVDVQDAFGTHLYYALP